MGTRFRRISIELERKDCKVMCFILYGFVIGVQFFALGVFMCTIKQTTMLVLFSQQLGLYYFVYMVWIVLSVSQ
eukprot:UN12714